MGVSAFGIVLFTLTAAAEESKLDSLKILSLDRLCTKQLRALGNESSDRSTEIVIMTQGEALVVEEEVVAAEARLL